MGAYQDVMSRAQGAANTPYQAYGGELTAGINPYQQQAFDAINGAAGSVAPYISEAAGMARGASGPITDADIGRYTDPYTQRVVDAYRRQQETQNAREQSSLVGNAAAKNALGGDRVSVAQSTLAGEQARAQDPVIAGLYSQGYQGALSAAQAEKMRQSQGAGQLAGFGVSGAQAGIAGGQAMLGAGTLQQQTEQQKLQAQYGQYQMAQAYPYQQAQWLAGITGSIGSQMGGTTTGETTTPPPDPWAQAAGLIAAGMGAYAKSDARVKDDIEQIGKTNDGLPIYRFKFSDDPSRATQIGLMAQDVEKVKPEAVAEFGGVKHINPDVATEGAVSRRGFAAGGGMPYAGGGHVPDPGYERHAGLLSAAQSQAENERDKWKSIVPLDYDPFEAAAFRQRAAVKRGFATGGGMPGMPWGGAQGWIPLVQGLTMGKTEPELNKWSEKKDQATDFSKYGQLGEAGKKAWDQSSDGTLGSAGQDYSLTGTGGTWARGGGVWLPGGYGPGGPVPGGFDDRFDAAYPGIPPATNSLAERFTPEDRMRAPGDPAFPPWFTTEALGDAVKGFAPASAPPPRHTFEQRLAPMAGKMVPATEPPEPDGVPLPRPRPALAGPTEDALPVGLSPAPGRPPVPASDEEPSKAPPAYRPPTAFSGDAEATPGVAPRRQWYEPGGGGDAIGNALMAAGFGMMASRSPHLGVAIGEGGLTGLSAYAGTQAVKRQEEEQKLTRAQEKRKFDLEVDKLNELSRHHRDTIAEAQAKEKLEALKPVVIHETRDKYGQVISSIKGVRDPATGGYRVINQDGSLGAVVQPGQVPPASTGTPNTTVAPRMAGASEEDQGIIPKNAELVSTGNYDYSTGAPDIERGMDVPSPRATSGYSPQGIRVHAENYILNGPSALPKVTFGSKGAAREQQEYVKAVQNYGNALAASRGIDPKELPELWRGSKGFQRYALGADGRTTTALGTAIRHLDTVDQLAKALAANDTRAINVVRTFLSRQFGGNGATDLMTAAKIVGPEVIKAIGVAGAGTGGEREAMEAFLDPRASPAQISGSILTLQKLLGGQLEGKRANAVDVTKVMSEDQFKNMVGARPYEILRGLEKAHGMGGVGGVPARSLSENDQKALDWAKGNPTDPRAGAIKKRLGTE